MKVKKDIMKTITAEEVRETGLDKFYTVPLISKRCIEQVGTLYDWNIWGLVIEPSAGNGSFLLQIPADRKIGIDIAPEIDGIIKQDFFDYTPPSNAGKILVIGNPPFGKVSSLAVKFFNHASQWADTIAFIIPRTFRRTSVQNRLNKKFHLIFDDEIPNESSKPSFLPQIAVKCCFQIWERRETDRDIIKLETTHNDWEWVSFGPNDSMGQPTPPKGADFAIRAYGGKCGEIFVSDLDTLRPKSYHWIKSKIDMGLLIERFSSLDYSISLDTARQNSIGRGELVSLYSKSYF